DTGLKELIASGAPLPFGGDTDPQNPVWDAMMPDAKIKRDKQAITTEEMFKDYDLYLNYMRGGPGFGDPIDRDPQSVVDDINGGYLVERFALQVYGVVAEKGADGTYAVDAPATAARRKEIRAERLAKSVPTREWMKGEREKILAKDAGDHVKQMFASSFKLGPKFFKDFQTFWDLPADWTLLEEEIGIPHYGSHYHMDVSELPDVKTVQFVEQ
ncbi:MAG: acetone carboxylase subunit alpha, partial [Azorhizobium sp. 39-67-5]